LFGCLLHLNSVRAQALSQEAVLGLDILATCADFAFMRRAGFIFLAVYCLQIRSFGAQPLSQEAMMSRLCIGPVFFLGAVSEIQIRSFDEQALSQEAVLGLEILATCADFAFMRRAGFIFLGCFLLTHQIIRRAAPFSGGAVRLYAQGLFHFALLFPAYTSGHSCVEAVPHAVIVV
jgi:hypothetical protein